MKKSLRALRVCSGPRTESSLLQIDCKSSPCSSTRQGHCMAPTAASLSQSAAAAFVCCGEIVSCRCGKKRLSTGWSYSLHSAPHTPPQWQHRPGERFKCAFTTDHTSEMQKTVCKDCRAKAVVHYSITTLMRVGVGLGQGMQPHAMMQQLFTSKEEFSTYTYC
jgi:hypothetical protein